MFLSCVFVLFLQSYPVVLREFLSLALSLGWTSGNWKPVWSADGWRKRVWSRWDQRKRWSFRNLPVNLVGVTYFLPLQGFMEDEGRQRTTKYISHKCVFTAAPKVFLRSCSMCDCGVCLSGVPAGAIGCSSSWRSKNGTSCCACPTPSCPATPPRPPPRHQPQNQHLRTTAKPQHSEGNQRREREDEPKRWRRMPRWGRGTQQRKASIRKWSLEGNLEPKDVRQKEEPLKTLRLKTQSHSPRQVDGFSSDASCWFLFLFSLFSFSPFRWNSCL